MREYRIVFKYTYVYSDSATRHTVNEICYGGWDHNETEVFKHNEEVGTPIGALRAMAEDRFSGANKRMCEILDVAKRGADLLWIKRALQSLTIYGYFDAYGKCYERCYLRSVYKNGECVERYTVSTEDGRRILGYTEHDFRLEYRDIPEWKEM